MLRPAREADEFINSCLVAKRNWNPVKCLPACLDLPQNVAFSPCDMGVGNSSRMAIVSSHWLTGVSCYLTPWNLAYLLKCHHHLASMHAKYRLYVRRVFCAWYPCSACVLEHFNWTAKNGKVTRYHLPRKKPMQIECSWIEAMWGCVKVPLKCQVASTSVPQSKEKGWRAAKGGSIRFLCILYVVVYDYHTLDWSRFTRLSLANGLVFFLLLCSVCGGLLPEAEDAEDDRAADEGRTADEGRKGEEGRKAEEGRDRGACLVNVEVLQWTFCWLPVSIHLSFLVVYQITCFSLSASTWDILGPFIGDAHQGQSDSLSAKVASWESKTPKQKASPANPKGSYEHVLRRGAEWFGCFMFFLNVCWCCFFIWFMSFFGWASL